MCSPSFFFDFVTGYPLTGYPRVFSCQGTREEQIIPFTYKAAGRILFFTPLTRLAAKRTFFASMFFEVISFEIPGKPIALRTLLSYFFVLQEKTLSPIA